MSCSKASAELERLGILLMQDQQLPSVVGVFCNRTVNGSWWSIPEAQKIFRCLDQLEETAIATRLIKRKVTYVHRRLWPALVTVGAARQPWQMRELTPDAKTLLRRMTSGESPAASGDAARELQQRLLVVAHETHTPSGRHELHLEDWNRWAARMKVTPLTSVEEAQRELEAASERIGAPPSALPWSNRKRAR
ncbi:MAG TPA: hypothetical protein VF057_07595 [Thermoanaerobaculia bacterium]